MEIKPGIGIDNLKFGMTQDQVVSLIGSPSRIMVDEDSESNNPVYQYNDLKLRLTFYSLDDLKLSYINAAHPNIKIYGNPIVGIPTRDVINSFGEEKENWDKEDHFSFIVYSNESLWSVLNEEYGVVTNIEIGQIYDESKEGSV